MDKVKILRLIDEADDIVSALYRQGANKDYKCKSLREKLKAIAAEITAPPKRNGDLIRQMTNEEIAHFISRVAECCSAHSECADCPVNGVGEFCSEDELVEYFGKDVGEDAKNIPNNR